MKTPHATRRALLGLAALPMLARAQGTPRRIGYLTPGTEALGKQALGALLDGFALLGAANGRDFQLDARFGDNDATRLEPLAQELARESAVVIAAGPAIDAVLKAHPTLPVVGLGELEVAATRARLSPDISRLTGVSLVLAEMNLKRLEVLAQLLPRGAGLVLLGAPIARGAADTLQVLAAARERFGLKVHEHYGLEAADVAEAFALARRERAAGLQMLNHPVLHGRRAQAMALASQARLPVMYQWPQSAREGGLMGYGPDSTPLYHQLARLAWRIATGTPAAQLPREQPTRIVLAINQKTAREQGLRVPRALLARADEVIE